MVEDVDFLGDREGVAHLPEHVVLRLAIIDDELDHRTVAFAEFTTCGFLKVLLPRWIVDRVAIMHPIWGPRTQRSPAGAYFRDEGKS